MGGSKTWPLLTGSGLVVPYSWQRGSLHHRSSCGCTLLQWSTVLHHQSQTSFTQRGCYCGCQGCYGRSTFTAKDVEKSPCGQKGLYNHVQIVMDVKDSYYVAREYMDCRACSGTYISWDSRILGQLSDGVRARFPVLMTRKYACDQSDIALLHSRTLGNSPTALHNTLHEIQSEEWLRRQLDYLSCCLKHQKGMKALNLPIPDYPKPTPFPPFPTAKWFLAAYVRDVWSRMDGLQGAAANTASWATNVGNEREEVLQSVLTSLEGVPALQRMADGLMDQSNCPLH